MLLSEFIRRASRALETLYPSPEAEGMVFLLCEELLGVKRYTHILEPSFVIATDKVDLLESSLARLVAGEPLQYVIGHTEFCGRQFKTAPGVLIPRPETEQLVFEAERLVENISKPRVLDLCTGSGCIAWSIALDVPDSCVTAVDISEEALCIASTQFSSGKSPEFIRYDILGPVPDLGQFDLIVSNPPYIMEREKLFMRKNVLDHEPSIALFVPDEDPMLFYKAVANWAVQLLKKGGSALVEINEQLPSETESVFMDAGFSSIKTMKDIFGKPRFVFFRND